MKGHTGTGVNRQQENSKREGEQKGEREEREEEGGSKGDAQFIITSSSCHWKLRSTVAIPVVALGTKTHSSGSAPAQMYKHSKRARSH